MCCSSCSEAGKARIEAEDQLARANQFAGVVPAEFAHWDERRGNNAALARARGKFNPMTRRGMILHGTSGTCKTRIMWELAKQLVASPDAPSWLWVDSYDCATAGFPAECGKVDFLFIDDLGNEPTSTKFETALLRLIRKRNDWHKPTIVSTQLTGDAFKRRFFNGAAAEAILRRFGERADKIAMHEGEQAKAA